MKLATVAFFCLFVLGSANVSAQDTARFNNVTMQLHPASPPNDRVPLRFLPAMPDLEEGNAAVVMLRMTHEQQGFQQNFLRQIPELLQLDIDDPRVVSFPFRHFKIQLKRAAFMSDAQWEYPLDSPDPWAILLPDAQTMRQYAGRGMSLWVAQQIVREDAVLACEGVGIQFACARHIARTPIAVTRLVGENIASFGLDRLEQIVQLESCPNLYWSLALLPDELGDTGQMLEWESNAIRRFCVLPDGSVPELGSDQWQSIAQKFSEYMSRELDQPLGALQAAAFRIRILAHADQSLRDSLPYDDAEIDRMTDEEKVMRWILQSQTMIHNRIRVAFELPPPRALAELNLVEDTIDQMLKDTGAPMHPFIASSPQLLVSTRSFDRRVKMLQAYEAIRDYASKHDGNVPTELSDCDLHVPDDPLTGEPFKYSSTDTGAVLMSLPVGDKATIRSFEIRQ